MTDFKTLMRRYRKSQDGNFAMMAVFASTTLLMAVGIAIDTMGMTSIRKTMQDRLDNAVLIAAGSGETKHSELDKIVKQALKDTSRHDWKMKHTVTLKDNEVIATATSNYSPMIMGMFNQGKYKVEVNAAAPIAQEVPVNVALALDTTGSMAGSNMSDLKDSATVLVDFIEAQKHPQSRIAVVPFNSYVNVGLTRRNVPWMNVPADGATGPAPACYAEQNYSSSGCTTSTETRYNDGVSYTKTVTTGCTTTSTPTGNTICPSAPTQTWRGCAGSRNAPDNILADASAANPIGGAMDASCGEEILPLTANYTDVRSKIASLTAGGNTYLPSGVIWGWRALTPNAPFTEAVTSPDNTIKTLILMTDGVNIMTQSARGSSTEKIYHHTYSPTDTHAKDEANDRFLGICNGAKADGISVFTIAYKLPGASKDTRKALESCASGPSFAFKANNKKQLREAFDDITKNLQTVRLSK